MEDQSLSSESESELTMGCSYSTSKNMAEEAGPPRPDWTTVKETKETENRYQPNQLFRTVGYNNIPSLLKKQDHTTGPNFLNSNKSSSPAPMEISESISLNPSSRVITSIPKTFEENHPTCSVPRPSPASENDCSSSDCNFDYNEDDDDESAKTPSPLDLSNQSWKLQECDHTGRLKLLRQFDPISPRPINESHPQSNYEPLGQRQKTDQMNEIKGNPQENFQSNNSNSSNATPQQQQQLIDFSEFPQNKTPQSVSSATTVDCSKPSGGSIYFPNSAHSSQNTMLSLQRPWNYQQNTIPNRFKNCRPSSPPPFRQANPGALPSFLSLGPSFYKPQAQFYNPIYEQNTQPPCNDANVTSVEPNSSSQRNPNPNSNPPIRINQGESRGNPCMSSVRPPVQRPFAYPPPPPPTTHLSHNSSTNFWRSLGAPSPPQYTYMNSSYEQSKLDRQNIFRPGKIDGEDRVQLARILEELERYTLPVPQEQKFKEALMLREFVRRSFAQSEFSTTLSGNRLHVAYKGPVDSNAQEVGAKNDLAQKWNLLENPKMAGRITVFVCENCKTMHDSYEKLVAHKAKCIIRA